MQNSSMRNKLRRKTLSRRNIGSVSVTRAEFYKVMAKQAADEARDAPEELKPGLLEIAERWLSLARLAEAQERSEPSETKRRDERG